LGDELVQTVNNASFSDKALFRIGVMDGLPKSLTVDMIQGLREEFPETPFSISEGHFQELKNDLLNHEIDVLLANFHPNDRSDLLYAQKFRKEPVSMYGLKEHLSLQSSFPKSLENIPVVLPSRHSGMRSSVEYWYKQEGIHYSLSAEAQDSSLKKFLALGGLGLVPLPEFSAKEYVNENKLFKIGQLTGVFEEYYLIMTKRVLKVPAAEYLTKTMVIE
jgi:LysR family transcriptional activator of nhaA